MVQKSKIDISGAFIAIGHDPATSLFKGKLKMDNENYIITKMIVQKLVLKEFLQLVM